MADKQPNRDGQGHIENPGPMVSRRKPLKQFKKCKSATFTLDGMSYKIGAFG